MQYVVPGNLPRIWTPPTVTPFAWMVMYLKQLGPGSVGVRKASYNGHNIELTATAVLS